MSWQARGYPYRSLGIIPELQGMNVVPPEWTCEYCGCQNSYEVFKCHVCGAPKKTKKYTYEYGEPMQVVSFPEATQEEVNEIIDANTPELDAEKDIIEKEKPKRQWFNRLFPTREAQG